MIISNATPLGFQATEVAEFRVDRIPDTHEEWSEQLGDLDLGQALGDAALLGVSLSTISNVSYSMLRSPDAGMARDWWAVDHAWHVDGTRWDKQPTFTVIACREAEEGVPNTELLDSARLLELTIEDDFWGKHELETEDVIELSSVFLDSTYQREALPFLAGLMDEEDRLAVEAIRRETVERSGFDDMDEYLRDMDIKYPSKKFDLIRDTPLSGLPSLFLDGGVRNAELVDPEGNDLTPVLHDLRWEYLTGDTPRDLGLVKAIEWTVGKCLIFPQVGTLHRASPGNELNRELLLGFIS